MVQHGASGWSIQASACNLLDARVSEVDYYSSRLTGEPLEGMGGIDTHPSSSRTLPLALTASF